MDIDAVAVEDIPGLPEAVEAHLPIVGDVEGAALPVGAMTMLPDVAAASSPLGLNAADMLGGPTLVSDVGWRTSLIDRAGMWSVQDISEGDDGVEVSLGRLGVPETTVLLSQEGADQLVEGELFIGLPERLYEKEWLLGTIKVVAEFRADEGSEPVDLDVWLPLLRVHCPRHPGCEAEYEVEEAAGGEGKVELSLFGIGGGAGKSLTFSISQTYASKERCIEIAVPAKLRLQMGNTLINGTEVAYGMRAAILSVDTGSLTERVLPAGSDGCQRAFDEVVPASLWRLDRREAQGKPDELQWSKLAIEQKSEGKVTLGLEIGTAPLKLGMEYLRTTSHTVTLKTGVSPGARYAAYSPSGPGSFEVCWTTL